MRALPILLLLAAPGLALADEVYLRGGGSISGVIVEHTDEKVTVDIGAGRMTVATSSVERITEGASDLSRYREGAAGLAPEDVEGWRQLGRQARKKGLAAQAKEAYNHVLAVLPDDPEANEALGRVFHQGRWMSEDEAYRAQGFVEFEQEWMTPGEREQILAERRAYEDAEQAEIDAAIQANEEARAADQALEEAERQAFWDSRMPASGGMAYWDWGVGPSVWPAEPIPATATW
jgi:hypothetical protein